MKQTDAYRDPYTTHQSVSFLSLNQYTSYIRSLDLHHACSNSHAFFPAYVLRYLNREEFVSAVRELRLQELACRERIKAVKCGLASVIPLELLALLTAEDQDLRVCGLPQVDLEYLKVCTPKLSWSISKVVT